MDTSNAYPNNKHLNVLVVIPAYNEQESIVSVVNDVVSAGYDYVVVNDQHDARCIPSLVELIESGSDLAIGSRFVEDTDGFRSTALRRLGIVWLSFWIKAFSGKRITDPTSGFRASSKKAMALFARNYPTDYPEPESIMLAIKSGLSVNEAPVTMRERQGGKSSIGGLSSLYYMIKVSLAILIVSFSHKRKRV